MKRKNDHSNTLSVHKLVENEVFHLIPDLLCQTKKIKMAGNFGFDLYYDLKI